MRGTLEMENGRYVYRLGAFLIRFNPKAGAEQSRVLVSVMERNRLFGGKVRFELIRPQLRKLGWEPAPWHGVSPLIRWVKPVKAAYRSTY